MKLVTLEKIRDALRNGRPEVELPSDLMVRARTAIERMLAIR
jgi:quinolinate synthase